MSQKSRYPVLNSGKSTSSALPALDGGSQSGPETDPKRVVVAGLVIILLVFGGLGVWAAHTEITAAVIAMGEVKVDSNRQAIQHLEGGIIKEILVENGTRVSRGEVLVRLESEQVRSTADLLRGQRDRLLAIKARLEAERDLASTVNWPPALIERGREPNVAEILEGEEKIFTARRRAMENEVKIIEAQVEQLRVRRLSLTNLVEGAERVIASLAEEIAAKAPLVEERFLEKTHLMELVRMKEEQSSRREQLSGERAQLGEQLDEMKLKMTNIRNSYQREASTRLGEIQNSLFEVEDRLRPIQDQARRLEIISPVNGVVMNRQIHTPGGVISPGATLMEILPDDSPLFVEAKVEVNKISHVREGQEAELVLAAFKQRVTPRARGIVSYVSADRLEERNNYGMMPYYLVYIEIDRNSLRQAIGDETLLSAGMPLEVYIQTKARTILSYLLEPITDTMRRALKEE